jgi:hypothetical protein
MTDASRSDNPGAFAQTYAVELLYEGPPPIRKSELLTALQNQAADISPLDGKADSDLLAFIHREHLADAGGRRIPAQTLLLMFNKGPDLGKVKASLDQSWSWPQAVEFITQARATLVINDVMSSALPPLERLVVFENVLTAVLMTYPPLAVHWRPTQQFISPQGFLDARKESGGVVYAPGPINVRLFRVEKEEGAAGGDEYFMDTLGLAALGLPDVQCHFRGLDPQAVSRVLYNTGIYLFEHGPIINDGDTVPGPGPDERWACRLAWSISLPDREVIDVIPPAPYAAGQE